MLVLFPHQLGEPLHGFGTVVILREPLMFDDRPYHKLKLAFLEACMRASGLPIVDALPRLPVSARRAADSKEEDEEQVVVMYDPLDNAVLDKYTGLLGSRLRVLEPRSAFLLTGATFERLAAHYRARDGAAVQHADFFRRARAALEVLVGERSSDADNRHPLPRDHSPAPRHASRELRQLKRECIAYVEARYPRNPGDASLLMDLPVTRRGARAHLQHFLASGFRGGRYARFQDAIHDRDTTVFHSHCSFLINVGLLRPREVLDAALRADAAEKKSIEAFVRQLLGWREYMRLAYVCWGRRMEAGLRTLPGRPLDFDAWTRGRTGIAPVDAEVRRVHREAWAHHIVRLMVFLNWMRLTDVRPSDVLEWFTTRVALDAYPWVMVPNVVAMGHYRIAGVPDLMRRAYVSSSAYLLRMSNYPRGDWCDAWDAAYRERVRGMSALTLRPRPRGG